MKLTAKILSALLSLAVLASGAAAFCTYEEDEQNGYIVVLNSTPLAETVKERAETVYSRGMYVVETEEEVEALRTLGIVETCEPNYVMELQDHYFTDLWNMNTVHAPYAWNHTNSAGDYDHRGDGVTVAIIDSGVYPHRDLDLSRFLEVPFQYQGFTQWHGTAVAGIIAAQLNSLDVDGVAPNVNIMSLCVVDQHGRTDTAHIISAIDYAIENGADVINISIGGTSRNTLLDDACERAKNAGIIVVASAGNYNSDSSQSENQYMYPASSGSAVSVSACRRSCDELAFDSSYSFFNDAVTVCAPGTEIRSLYPDDLMSLQTGTSFASPIVTAMAALAKQSDRGIGLDEFVELLAETSVDLGEPGKDIYYGYGVVDIEAFIDRLCELYPESAEKSEPIDEPDVSSEPVAIPFTDIADTWAYDAIEFVYSRSLMTGTAGDKFSPDDNLSRAMLATMLYRLAGSPDYSTASPFTDVPENEWYTDAVGWASENGIVTGNGDGTFDPEVDITREQMATMLLRFAKLLGFFEAFEADLTAFEDCGEISDWAFEALTWANATGLITGRTTTRIVPTDTASRAEAATLMMRFCRMSGK